MPSANSFQRHLRRKRLAAIQNCINQLAKKIDAKSERVTDYTKGLYAALVWALSILEAPCAWTPNECHFDTSCNEAFEFTEGGPKENRVRYCPFCGKWILVADAEEEAASHPEAVRTDVHPQG